MNVHPDEPAHDFDTVIPRDGTASLKWDRYAGRDVLPFWVADMDFQVAPVIQEALLERIQHPIYGYTLPPTGLAEAVISHLSAEYDWSVEADWIVWLPGVVPGLAAACRAFCSTGEEALVNPPIYHHFFDSHEAPRQRLIEVPLQQIGQRRTYDIEAMRAACTDQTRLLMLCSPHNPVGTVFTAEELAEIGELGIERDLIVVSDEIHCDLVLDETVHHVPTALACPALAPRLITLMSASKTFNIAGLNCSFAIIADKALRARFAAGCRNLVPPVPPLAYAATRAAYASGQGWRRQLITYLQGNLALLAERVADMPGLTLLPLQATYLAWIDATALGLDDPQAFFEEQGVGLSNGQQFGQSGYLRLNFACPRSMLDAGLSRMAKALAGR